jgi:hypothetical protein
MTDRSPSPLPGVLPPVRIKYNAPPKSPDPVKIFIEAILLTEGRDKVVKLLQYTSRLILLFSPTHIKRLKPFISQMSMTRKVLKLGHGVFPYYECTQMGIGRYELVRAVVEFINDFWDDVYCLSRIGFLRSAKVQYLSEIWANRAWMTGIVMDLHVLMEKRTKMMKKIKDSQGRFLNVPGMAEKDMASQKLGIEAFWIDISILKLLADLGFCGILLLYSN